MSIAVFRPSGVLVVTTDTRANILASSPTSNALAYATDSNEFLVWDSGNSEWRVAPLELQLEDATPDMGAYSGMGALGVSDKAGYYDTGITDKRLSNILIGDSARDVTGSFRLRTGTLQIYTGAAWEDVVTGFVFREDSSGGYELEHIPVGLVWWYEVMSGNSDNLDFYGEPLIHQYGGDMGAYQTNLIVDGGTF